MRQISGYAATVTGLKCAWCGKILRLPVGVSGEFRWSHGICRSCMRRVLMENRWEKARLVTSG